MKSVRKPLRKNTKPHDMYDELLNNSDGYLHCILGSPGAGKSVLALSILFNSLWFGLHTHYIVITRTLFTELNDSYKWLMGICLRQEELGIYMRLYTDYIPMIVDNAVTMAQTFKNNNIGEKLCILFDDSTSTFSSSGRSIANDTAFMDLVTTSRHLCITTILVTHAMKGILLPAIRIQIRTLTLFYFSNKPQIKHLFDEYINACKDFNKLSFTQFMTLYREKASPETHAALFLNPQTCQSGWDISKCVEIENFLTFSKLLNKRYSEATTLLPMVELQLQVLEYQLSLDQELLAE